MALKCEKCGTHTISIVDADETKDTNGYVVRFREVYQCDLCEGEGTLFADSTDGKTNQRTTGILN